MRRLPFVLSVALMASALAPTPGSTSQTAPAQAAETLWRAVSAVRWSDTYQTWRAQHRQVACEPFSAPPDEIVDAAGLWSYHCREHSISIEAEWLFYALDVRPPIAARMEQMRVSVDNLPADQLEAAAHELISLVSGTNGAPAADNVSEFGSAFWRAAARWETAEVEIVVGVDEFPGRTPRLNAFVRHRPLVTALNTFTRVSAQLADDLGASDLTNAELAAHLRERFPEPAALLASSEASAIDTNAAVRGVTLLLDGADAQTRADVPERLFAADRLADRLAMTDRESAAGDEARRLLGADHVTFEWSELGGSWVYTHDLLWRLWRDHRDTAWGDRAFASLLARGWDTHVGCRAGSDQFRQVISEATGFLQTRPASSIRLQVLFLFAQAYETWWSLSLASDRDDYVDRTQYQTGAASARRQAIATYQEIVRRYPDSAQADYAHLVLPRLLLGLDTGERRFFCVYD